MTRGLRLRRRWFPLLWALVATTPAGGSEPQVPEVPDLLRQTVSMSLVDASLVDFFRTVAELSELNLLIDSDVSGRVTLRVERLSLHQVVEAVLKSHSLEQTTQGGLIRISRQETLRAEKERDRKMLEQERENQPPITVARSLNYASAEAVAKTLNRQLGEKGRLDVDTRTNTVLVTDIPARVSEIDRLLDRLDVAGRQVEIEARIIEATTNFARNLGLQFDVLFGGTGARGGGSVRMSTPSSQGLATPGVSAAPILDTVRLDAVLAAAESDGEVRILSKPRVSALNNVEATITQGARIPIPVEHDFTTTVRFETAALRLLVTPQITREKTILLKIKVENNVPDFSRTVQGIPTILTSESQTVVLIPHEGTAVIGGILLEIDRTLEQKVPGLARIPVLGRLFRRDSQSRETREIIFFITPRIR